MMQTQIIEQVRPRFLVRMTVCEGDPVDARKVRDAIECLGGVGLGDYFAFPTLQARAVAMDLLGDKFGMRYVCSAGTDHDIEREIAVKAP